MKSPRGTIQKQARKSSATIRDVAEASGVTAGTVSRVLNNRLGEMKVPSSTRQKIEQAAERLGYAPNIHARRLFGKRAGVLGMVVPSLQNLGTLAFDNLHLTRILSGMESELVERDYRILLIFNDARFVSEKKYLSLYRERSVDGLFVWGAGGHETFWKEIISDHRPLLFLGNAPPVPSAANFVLSDDEGAGFRAATYLLKKGRRRLAWLGGKKGVSVTDLQLSGIRRAMRSSGLDPDSLVVVHGDFQESSGVAAVETLFKKKVGFDALIGANGNTCTGASKVLAEANAVVEIVSCDSVAGGVRSLAGARVQTRDVEIGKRAVMGLVDLVEGKRSEVREWMDFDFIAADAEA
ncbi:MAG: LacI family DNA-binding transcriptional regulator [Spirochaetia bacterium]|nr:LacI family DNA-binding transcriptional regulator [Spirochaetia bacterium]